MTRTHSKGNGSIDALALGIVSAFPALDRFEQRLSLELYRLLAAGHPVVRPVLADRLQAPVEIVDRILDHWPGVFSDSERRIVGYWGLSVATAYASPHTLTIDSQTLSAWCAWDTLFLPHLLGKPAQVESKSPGLASVVKLIVTPTRVDGVEPKSESNNKLNNCLRRVYSKVDDQVHCRPLRFGQGKAMAQGLPHLERVSG